MSLPRFFLEEQVLARIESDIFELLISKDDLRHAKVLRLSLGEHIAVIDAENDYFECEIVSLETNLIVRITQHASISVSRPCVTLIQGLCKGDKMDDVIRHATELGVSSFIPLICERSVVKLDAKKTVTRIQRWESIAKSAAMQSGQPCIPSICAPMKPHDAACLIKDFTAVLVCWEEEQILSVREALQRALSLSSITPQEAHVAVVVGPEGGLTEEEVSLLCSQNPRSFVITLGSSILRTETAGIVAPALVLYELGGLQ